MKKHCESTEPERHQMAKTFSFFLLLQRDSSKLHNSFTKFSHKTAFYTEHAVYQPIAYSQFWSLTRHFKLGTEELWLHLWCHFFILMHVYKVLSNET